LNGKDTGSTGIADQTANYSQKRNLSHPLPDELFVRFQTEPAGLAFGFLVSFVS
jgi:hypothetical protein